MYIQLEKKDCEVIAKSIADSFEDKGILCVNIDGMEFNVDFYKTTEGYYENNELTYTMDLVIYSLDVVVYSIRSGNSYVRFKAKDIEDYAKSLLKERIV